MDARYQERYYAYIDEDTGKITRVARLGGDGENFGAYGWEKDHWEDMPGLWKIENDITDYRPVTKEEADAIMEAQKSGKTGLNWKDYIAELRP